VLKVEQVLSFVRIQVYDIGNLLYGYILVKSNHE